MNIGFTSDNMGKVEKIIKKWKPKGCKTEKDYEKSLVKFLHEKMPDVKIVQQYGTGTQRIDIVVGEKVAIELKKGLKTTSAYHRLRGQLKEYEKNWDKIFVVVCGAVKDNLKKDLEALFEDMEFSFFDPDCRVIFK